MVECSPPPPQRGNMDLREKQFLGATEGAANDDMEGTWISITASYSGGVGKTPLLSVAAHGISSPLPGKGEDVDAACALGGAVAEAPLGDDLGKKRGGSCPVFFQY